MAWGIGGRPFDSWPWVHWTPWTQLLVKWPSRSSVQLLLILWVHRKLTCLGLAPFTSEPPARQLGRRQEQMTMMMHIAMGLNLMDVTQELIRFLVSRNPHLLSR